MIGNRKLAVVGGVLLSLLAGLVMAKDSGSYTAFAAACVAAGGLYFKANVDAKGKAQP